MVTFYIQATVRVTFNTKVLGKELFHMSFYFIEIFNLYPFLYHPNYNELLKKMRLQIISVIMEEL